MKWWKSVLETENVSHVLEGALRLTEKLRVVTGSSSSSSSVVVIASSSYSTLSTCFHLQFSGAEFMHRGHAIELYRDLHRWHCFHSLFCTGVPRRSPSLLTALSFSWGRFMAAGAARDKSCNSKVNSSLELQCIDMNSGRYIYVYIFFQLQCNPCHSGVTLLALQE